MLSLGGIKDILSSYPPFAGMVLKVEVLNIPKKKDDFWGTSVKRFLTDGTSKFEKEGIIYVNLRDIKDDDDDKLLRIIAHEGSHLLDDGPEIERDILQYLRDRLEMDNAKETKSS